MPSVTPAKRSDVRKDPDYRIADFENAFDIVGRDPERVYKWVSKSTPADAPGIDTHQNVFQYDVELWTEGGVRPACLKFTREREGRPIEVSDQVLMSLPKKVAHARWAHGQKKTDEREKSIIRRRGNHDPMRGIGKLTGETFKNDRYTSFEADVSPLTSHVGES